MEIIVYALVVIFLLISLLGSFIPSLPGPILSYMALLLYHAFISSVTINHLIWLALLVLFVTFLDYYLQIYGVKKAGRNKLLKFDSFSLNKKYWLLICLLIIGFILAII